MTKPDKIDLILQLILDICILGTLTNLSVELGTIFGVFILTSKIAKNHLMRPKRGCPTRLQKFFQGQLKGFLGSKRYKYPKLIAKLNLSYQVESHERSTF